MNIHTLQPYAETVASVATVAGLLYGIQIYRRQAQLRVFTEYTRRFNEVMARFPPQYQLQWHKIPFPEGASDADLQCACIAYLNLCAEEFQLQSEGLISRRIWKIWEAEMRVSLRSPLMRGAWRKLRGGYGSSADFVAWVNAVQSDAAASP